MKLNDKRKKSLYLIIPIFTATLAIVGAQATNLFRKPINIDAIDSEYSIIFSKDDNDIESKKIKTNDNNELYFSVSGLGSGPFTNSKDYIAIINYDKPFEFKNNYMPELPNCNRITGIKEINIDYSIVLGTYSDPDYTNTRLQIDLYIDYGWDINLQNNEYYGSINVWNNNSFTFTNQPSFFRIFSKYNDTPPNTVSEPYILIRSIEIIYSCQRSELTDDGLVVLPYSGPIDSTIEDPRFCVAGYVGKASEIEIPSNFKNGVIVAIGPNAFKDNKEIVSVNLPKTITVIEEYAFSNCDSLKSINLDNIRYMQDYVFENCVSLEMVNLSILSTTVHGGKYYYSRFAFSSCDNLKVIKVGTKSYGRYYGTFVKDCPRLEKFIVCCTSISSSFVINTPNLKLACLGVSLTNPSVSTTTVPFPDLENLKIIIANNDNIHLYNYENATIYRYGRFVGYNSDFLAAPAYPTTLFDYLGDYNPLVIPYKYVYYDNSTQYVHEMQAVVKCIDIDEFENYDKIAYFEGSYEIWNGIEKKQNVNYDVAFYNETGKNMDNELLYWRYVNNVPTLW